MNNEALIAELNSLKSIVNGLMASQGHTPSGVSHDEVEALQQRLKNQEQELRLLRGELSVVKREASDTATRSAKAGVLNTIEGAMTPVVQALVDHEKDTAKQVATGIASVSADITAAKSIAGQQATASRDLLLATVSQFSRG